MGRKGFTLVEILLASVILALTTLLLHESYLRLADLYGRYLDGIRLEEWTHDQLWESREQVVYGGANANVAPASGVVTLGSKDFSWSRNTKILSGRDLYSIELNVSWNEGNRPMTMTKKIYAFHKNAL